MSYSKELYIETVRTKTDLKKFIKLPWKIYKENFYWVPPLIFERKFLLDKNKNPFFKHAEAEYFLAYKNNEIVGRISAIINHNHNREHNENIGFFGFFECINDQNVANSLFDTAKKWLKERKISIIRGPANPSVNDEYGLLIEGFDKSPVVMMPYNPPYYPLLIEGAGLQKIKDLYAYYLSHNIFDKEKIERVINLVQDRYHISVRTINMKEFDNEVKIIEKIYNEAWQYNWGAVKMTQEEFDTLAKSLKSIVDPELVLIAEVDKKPVGFALSLPDINQILKYNRSGWLIPAMFRLIKNKKQINGIRIIALGVLKEYQRTGAAGFLFYETAVRALKQGYDWGEASWVLEDNIMMNRSAEMMNAILYKKYRIYQQNF